MSTIAEASGAEPTRPEIDRMAGSTVLNFGASWCGHCRKLAPGLAALLRDRPEVRYIGIEDGPGLPLGRSFGVKLWPTLIFLRDGRPVARAVRPGLGEVRDGLDALRRDDPSGLDRPS